MKRLWMFIAVAVVAEVLAITVNAGKVASWIMEVIVGLVILYLVLTAVRGWRKQMQLALPPAMHGRIVRKRHWRLF